MTIALFIGGIFLGVFFGLVVMALLATARDHCHCEEVEIIGSGFACAYPPSPGVSPPPEQRPKLSKYILPLSVER
jgi:hypothetical protein